MDTLNLTIGAEGRAEGGGAPTVGGAEAPEAVLEGTLVRGGTLRVEE